MGISPSNLGWYQKTRMITLSCGIKISAVYSFVSPRSTHVMEGRIDGRTELRPQDHASIAASRGKNWPTFGRVKNE